ncbi:SDR family NAD(P)-dependent oxidoreductase [Salidesulfovibrio brasiliensis]|uniref:SDR family NAD(P)-dependent oxidoreductase n=1 Tax=Salidesulfovibrio brasiliensis TaxID=221711 RepID=UPI0009FA4AC1|nr:SDR family oxidoreductase [Salidesulfovibrio brasiliensis]
MTEIAIITGVSKGLGRALALRLIQDDVTVVGVSRSEPGDQELKQAVEQGKLLHVAADVTEAGVAETVVARAAEAGAVRHLFNCAGAGVFGPCGGYSRADLDKAFGANLTGLILMSEAVTEPFKCDGGVIVNVMSTAALAAKAGEAVYCAAKWGARAYTESLRAECKGTAAKVVAVYPGGMKTGFWESATNSSVNPSNFMDPDEVAGIMIRAVGNHETAYVSDLTINRK